MIRITSDLAGKIRAEAEAAWPEECCGLLAGLSAGVSTGGDDGVTVTRLAASPNVAAAETRQGKADTFEIDPEVRFRLMRELEGGDERIVGHYHSHPDHPAEPSGRDIDMAFEPELVWLIVAVKDGRVETMTAWRLDRETRAVQTVELVIS